MRRSQRANWNFPWILIKATTVLRFRAECLITLVFNFKARGSADKGGWKNSTRDYRQALISMCQKTFSYSPHNNSRWHYSHDEPCRRVRKLKEWWAKWICWMDFEKKKKKRINLLSYLDLMLEVLYGWWRRWWTVSNAAGRSNSRRKECERQWRDS